MPLWGNEDFANNAPKYVVSANTGNTGVQQYANTESGAWGIQPSEMAHANADPFGHAGWNYRHTYTDTHGNTRVKGETLIAMSSITESDVGGVANDDVLFPGN